MSGCILNNTVMIIFSKDLTKDYLRVITVSVVLVEVIQYMNGCIGTETMQLRISSC